MTDTPDQDLSVENALLRGSLWITANALREYHDSPHFELDDATLDSIRSATANGDKYLPELPVRVVDEQGKTVAHIRKTLYIRRKQPKHNA